MAHLNKRLITILAVAVAVLALPASAAAGPLAGKVKFDCAQNGFKKEDPLTNPGPPGTESGHLHAWGCNQRFGADVDSNKLLDGTNSGFLPGQKAVYWWPAGINGAGNRSAGKFSAYYAGNLIDSREIAGSEIQPFPQGWSLLAGQPEVRNFMRWRCQDEGFGVYGHPPLPPERDCAYLDMEIDAPQCWDGKHLDVADHKSHMAYGFWSDSTGDWRFKCPSSHPTALPQIQAQVRYEKPEGGWSGWHLSSDHEGDAPGETAHFDVIQVEESPEQALWMTCVNDPGRNSLSPPSPSCGTFTWADTPWGKTLSEAVRHLGTIFVLPNGDPNWEVYNLP